MRIIFGTCDGTGAAINVCLGGAPVYVKLWNMEDAVRQSVIEWINQMALVSALDEGIKTHGLSDTDLDRTVMASAGIAAYAGGDELFYDSGDGQWEDSGGTVKEEVYVDGQYMRTAAGDAAYRCFGDVAGSKINGEKIVTSPGFTLGADADLNVNGEQIAWMAIMPSP